MGLQKLSVYSFSFSQNPVDIIVNTLYFFGSSPDVPGPPGIPDISDVDKNRMTLTWTPPTDDGGSKILGYIVEKCDADRKRWTKAHKEDLVTELTLTVYDLTEGTNYMFRVSAENAAGVGESSPATQPKKAKPPYGKLVSAISK